MSISDILVNGSKEIYIERGGPADARQLRRSATTRTSRGDRSNRKSASDDALTNRRRWWMRGFRTDRASTRSFRRLRSTAPFCRSGVLESTSRSRSCIDNGTLNPTMAIADRRLRCRSPEHSGVGRYGIGQDDTAQCDGVVHSGRPAHHHDRGCGRAETSAGARRATGDASAKCRGRRRSKRARPREECAAYAS